MKTGGAKRREPVQERQRATGVVCQREISEGGN